MTGHVLKLGSRAIVATLRNQKLPPITQGFKSSPAAPRQGGRWRRRCAIAIETWIHLEDALINVLLHRNVVAITRGKTRRNSVEVVDQYESWREDVYRGD